MTATSTAIRVLRWAAAGDGPPPSGDLLEPAQLARPGPALRDALISLLRPAAARMRVGSPPLGDDRPAGIGTALMAAAIGSARSAPDDAGRLLDAIPKSSAAADLVLRHALVARALPHLPIDPPKPRPGAKTDPKTAADTIEGSVARAEPGTADPETEQDPAVRHPIRADWMRLSPLTCLTGSPPEHMQDEIAGMAADLLQRPAARRWMVMVLAQPASDRSVRLWRRELMGRLLRACEEGEDLVLNIYEANAVYHHKESMNQVRAALATLTGGMALADEDERLNDALSVAAWWRPLRELRRQDPRALRQRRHLGYGYLEGLELCRLAEKMIGRGL